MVQTFNETEIKHLDLGLHVLNSVRGLDLEGDGLASEGLDKDLHPAAEPEDEVEGTLLLDVVVREGAAILQLLAGEDQPLLVRGDPLLVLQQVNYKSRTIYNRCPTKNLKCNVLPGSWPSHSRWSQRAPPRG